VLRYDRTVRIHGQPRKVARINKRQTVALWLGITMMLAMFLYPPWHIALSDGRGLDFGYAFLRTGPSQTELQRREAGNARFNYPRLAAQWFLVAVITGAAIVTLKDR